jgi:wyosine [tRNA(Phe)-imidazoG37] synthetase (radical SAM superfamily)
MEKESTKGCNVYGPVPSRRLGRSLGIDLVPLKTCTYDCVYCQLGRTTNKTVERKEYVKIDDILMELEVKLGVDPQPDYISLAGSGEPTLHSRIGDLIEKIKGMTKIPIAVITNGSLLWQEEVRDALMGADLVLPSLDATDGDMFRYVNRPHEDIAFTRMIGGIDDFIRVFPGSVWMEVFLLAGVTAIPAEVKKFAVLVEKLNPERVQLNTVYRPPAEDFAEAVSVEQLTSFRNYFTGNVEIITEYPSEPSPAVDSKITEVDIMALLKRRPCTLQDVSAGLALSPMSVMKELSTLCRLGKVENVTKRGHIFYKVTS